MISMNSHEIKQTPEPHNKHLLALSSQKLCSRKEAEWKETKEVKITTKEPEVSWIVWTERVYLWVFTKVVNRPSSLRSKFEAVSHSTRKPSERTRTILASKMWDTRCWKKEKKNRWVKEGSATNDERKEMKPTPWGKLNIKVRHFAWDADFGKAKQKKSEISVRRTILKIWMACNWRRICLLLASFQHLHIQEP